MVTETESVLREEIERQAREIRALTREIERLNRENFEQSMLPGAPKWVRVKDRPPTAEVGDWCIGFLNGKSGQTKFVNCVTEVGWDDETKTFYRTDTGENIECVTHWMPMPAPPEEGDNG